jgi:hypothetical protein
LQNRIAGSGLQQLPAWGWLAKGLARARPGRVSASGRPRPAQLARAKRARRPRRRRASPCARATRPHAPPLQCRRPALTGDAQAIGPEVPKPQDAAAVGHHDGLHVLLGPGGW